MGSLEIIPAGFWVATVVLLVLVAEVALRTERPWSKPLLVAYGTVGMWYHLDFLYNGPEVFAAEFASAVVNEAFLEVCWFLICLRGFVGVFAGVVPKRIEFPPPTLWAVSARQEHRLFVALASIWIGLIVYALIRTNGEVMALVCPPLSQAGSPWGRDAVGGRWDFAISAAGYTHLAICGMAGVLVAIARRPGLRAAATMLWLTACPVFVFGRARNTILGIVLPGMLAYVLSERVPVVRKVGLSLAVFMALSAWFSFIQQNRNSNFAVLRGETEGGINDTSSQSHLGLDMFHELCYINEFLTSGKYEANWGERYFSELTVVVPRSLWQGKPYIGIDYAVARGFGGSDSQHGVFATVSTGMIGQGLVNFGKVFGPVVAAGLLAAWVCILARLWLQRRNINRMLLCLLGIGQTINLGRDITLLVLFPFVFAYIGVRVYELQFRTAIPVRRTGDQPG